MNDPWKKSVSIPLYRTKLYIAVGHPISEAVRLLPSEVRAAFSKYDAGGTLSTGTGKFAIVFDEKHLTHETIGHEIDHLTRYVLDYHEVRKESEATAYLNGILHRIVYREFSRRGVNVKVR